MPGPAETLKTVPRTHRKEIVSRSPIPVCVPSYGEREAASAARAVREGWVTSDGPYVRQFEERFSRVVRASHGVATSSGTAALHVSLAALGIGPGDEVIVPDFTMVACLDTVLYVGATPVFVDVDPETWTLNLRATEAAITAKTRAVMPVHIYGHPVEMDGLRRIARAHDIAIVEDAAEAHGSEFRGTPVGALGDLGCFSFYATKVISTGEGGMVVTRSARLARRTERLHELAYASESRNYRHTEVGFNYRLTDVQAAVGLAQLDRLSEFVRHRRRCARIYREAFEGVEGLRFQDEASWAKSAYWVFTVLLPGGAALRTRVATELLRRGVSTRVAFWPLHRQPFAPRHNGARNGFPVSDRLGQSGLTLPFGNGISESTIADVADTVRSVVRSLAPGSNGHS